jgi:hypothetical protein
VIQRRTPPGKNPAARNGRDSRESGLDGVGSLPVLDLGGRYRQSEFFAHGPGQEAAHAMRLPGSRLHQLGQGRSVRPLQQFEDRRGQHQPS